MNVGITHEEEGETRERKKIEETIISSNPIRNLGTCEGSKPSTKKRHIPNETKPTEETPQKPSQEEDMQISR